MHFSVLGPVQVVDETGTAIDLGGRQPRVMLAVLVAAGARPVPADALIDAIWGEEPPPSAAGTLQSYVSRARGRIGAERLVLGEAGYRLAVPPEQLVHVRFERLADEGRSQLDAGDPERARDALVAAERLWRGPALGDLADLPALVGTAARLDELRLVAIEGRIAADLALGRHDAAVAELTEAVVAHPLREQLQAQLALALYRSGRQADALRALDRAGRMLRDELGVEPGRELRELEAAILRHDPDLDPVRAPGAAAPAAPGALGARPGGAGPVASERTLPGRASELAVLRQVVRECATDGRIVVVEGEPGIGKTRLADEAAALVRAGGGWSVWGRTDEGGAAPALWPWLPPLRALGEHAGPLAPGLAELVAGEVPMETRQVGATRFETFEAVAELLARAGASGPVAVCLDDLQWADEASLELLEHLTGRLAPGVLVVVTVRQLEVGRNDGVTDALAAVARRAGSRRLVLRGLDAEATRAAVATTAERELGPEQIEAIHLRAEGNPFYAIELARLLGEEGRWGAEVPGSVGDVIRRRLARLPASTLELLGVGAVVGREIDLSVLARAAGTSSSEVLDVIEPAVVHRLVLEVPDSPGRLRVSHALVREVLLEDLTGLRRARLHLAVADAIEATGAGVDDAEILAEHLWRAVPTGVGERAADALERAAEVAISRLAYVRAEEVLGRAVALRRAAGSQARHREAELDTLVRMLEVARAVRYFQGAPPAAIARAKELAALTGRQDRLVDVLWFECASLATAARVVDAERMAADLLEVTERSDDPAILASGVETIAVNLWGRGRIAEAAVLLDEARALLDQVSLPDDPFRAERRLVTHTFWLYTHAVIGDVALSEVWAAHDALLTSLPDPVSRASVAGFAATTAVVLHEWERAAEFIRRGSEANPSAQFGFWYGQMLMVRGALTIRDGDVAEGLATFSRGTDVYRGIGGGSGIPTFTAVVAIALLERGEIAEAAVAAAVARAELDRTGEGWNVPNVLLAEAGVALHEGRADEAHRLHDEAVASAEGQGAGRLAAAVERQWQRWVPATS
jgi:DNA-binding SARP family transcriptional activator